MQETYKALSDATGTFDDGKYKGEEEEREEEEIEEERPKISEIKEEEEGNA